MPMSRYMGAGHAVCPSRQHTDVTAQYPSGYTTVFPPGTVSIGAVGQQLTY